MKDLTYIDATGTINSLPTWYQLRGDEEIAEAKAILIEESKNSHELTDEEIDNIVNSEMKEVDKLVESALPQLKASGFNNSQIEIIVSDLYAGRTLDSAMQQFA